jgi:dihydrofolate reductase
MDPSVDFASLFANVDTVLLGRRSYDAVVRQGGSPPWAPGTRVYVVSRTLRPEEHPDLTIVSGDIGRFVSGLRAEAGDGEIWLFGGGSLLRSLLTEAQVDAVEITVVPILLGGGVPLLQPGAPRTVLTLTGTRVYPSGMVSLSYAVQSRAAELGGAGDVRPGTVPQ